MGADSAPHLQLSEPPLLEGKRRAKVLRGPLVDKTFIQRRSASGFASSALDDALTIPARGGIPETRRRKSDRG